jgi:predicted HicB family RNase H-like nuclease
MPNPLSTTSRSTRFLFHLPADLYRRVVEAARKQGVSAAAWIREAILARLG